jgi:hypothetical protein
LIPGSSATVRVLAGSWQAYLPNIADSEVLNEVAGELGGNKPVAGSIRM